MLTLDDRRVREALIRTHDQFQEHPETWTRKAYERASGPLFRRHRSRCVMGEIGYQLGLDVNHLVMDTNELWRSVKKWFVEILHNEPEVYNDHHPLNTILGFLEARIADLDRELVEAAPKPQKSFVMSLMSIFG